MPDGRPGTTPDSAAASIAACDAAPSTEKPLLRTAYRKKEIASRATVDEKAPGGGLPIRRLVWTQVEVRSWVRLPS